MKNTVSIEVTQSCIDEGRKDNAASCPVALAFHNIGYEDVCIDPFLDILLYDKNGKERSLIMTKKASDFILRFDEGKKVTPKRFTFYFGSEK